MPMALYGEITTLFIQHVLNEVFINNTCIYICIYMYYMKVNRYKYNYSHDLLYIEEVKTRGVSDC